METSNNKQLKSQKNITPKNSSNISVFIRIRPFNHLETATESCIQFSDDHTIAVNLKQAKQGRDKQTVVVNHTLNHSNNFIFDHIFGEQIDQEEVYDRVGKNVIDSALEGINGTIFCYGQTSSGKTHTCVGSLEQKQKFGILPRLVLETLSRIEEMPKNMETKMKISMVQIYNQKIRDLIDIQKQDLKVRANKKDGIFLQNVTERYILSEKQAFEYLQKGIDNRAVNATNMNACSSRSHMLFIITINTHDLYTGLARTAKISLVDLAGSQKISKTGAEGKVLEEAKKINTSLTALGKVINALSDSKSSHIPYRESKLTRLLQESLGGNCLTNLIVNISPSSYNQSETLTSLRFGARAKSIKNQPKVNKSYTVNQLLALLAKAEKTIKEQNQTITALQDGRHNRRQGGYGTLPIFPNLITMHIIPDEELLSDGERTQSSCSLTRIREHEENSGKTQSSYKSEFMSLNTDSVYVTEQKQEIDIEEEQNKKSRKVSQEDLHSFSLGKDLMKNSLPCFSQARGFSKSARKIKKVVTLLPSNKQNIDEIENQCPDKILKHKRSVHLRKRSSSVEKMCENNELEYTDGNIKQQMSTQTCSFWNKENIKQSVEKSNRVQQRGWLNKDILENVTKIKENFVRLRMKYLGERAQNSINELIIQRKNDLIEKYSIRKQ